MGSYHRTAHGDQREERDQEDLMSVGVRRTIIDIGGRKGAKIELRRKARH